MNGDTSHIPGAAAANWIGHRTMTTESSGNSAFTLTCVKASHYIGHVTIFSWMLTDASCYSSVMVYVRLQIRFSVWLVSGYADTSVIVSVVFELDPVKFGSTKQMSTISAILVTRCRHWLCEVTPLQNAADAVVIARHVAQKCLMQQVHMFLAHTHLHTTLKNITTF